MRVWLGLTAFFLVLPSIAGVTQEGTLHKVGHITAPPIDESSGLIPSGQYKGVFWTHNDSGDTARIFAIRRDGHAVTPNGLESSYQGIRVPGAKNVDWEDIARDGRTLYISDMGNNGNSRRDLGIYEVPEPNPTRDQETKPARLLPIRYPDQTEFPPKGLMPFDCEAIFTLRGKLYLVTKHRLSPRIPGMSANLYRLDTRYTDRPNVLTKLDSREGLGGWVTAADVSPDGETLAVLCHAPVSSVWLFSTQQKGDRFLSDPHPRRIVFSGGNQTESLAFTNNDTLLIGNEQRDLFELRVSAAASVEAGR